ncbi:TetR/AcrR family transcriptional regulator [Bifidobacterium callitrichidarum]|uniref:TetR family transcriptional regulator n=1 Tax=Bifidobacterium callitrichidarum TaxID=2052941 RepID=A0A2U2NAY4_9BIFI|nr:TetR/AcrR family transcriptional regulator [Bifidobacterium callitrichidarum]PWG66315.1 TetR family transcriptional regulator [Bifidobacterium callitrichidarum]
MVEKSAADVQRHRPETEARRKAILQAAVEVFGQKGSAKGTLEEVAEKAGMTRAGVLHHFGSKQRLLLETMQYRDSIDVAGYANKHIPDGADLFRHLIKTAQMNQQRKEITRAYVTLSSESVADGNVGYEYFKHRYEVLRGELSDALKVMGKARGVEVDEKVALNTSAAILAAMDGLQLQWILDPEAVDLSEATEYMIRALVAQVFNPGEQAI